MFLPKVDAPSLCPIDRCKLMKVLAVRIQDLTIISRTDCEGKIDLDVDR